MFTIYIVGDIHVGWARSSRLGEVGKIKQALLEGNICLWAPKTTNKQKTSSPLENVSFYNIQGEEMCNELCSEPQEF